MEQRWHVLLFAGELSECHHCIPSVPNCDKTDEWDCKNPVDLTMMKVLKRTCLVKKDSLHKRKNRHQNFMKGSCSLSVKLINDEKCGLHIQLALHFLRSIAWMIAAQVCLWWVSKVAARVQMYGAKGAWFPEGWAMPIGFPLPVHASKDTKELHLGNSWWTTVPYLVNPTNWLDFDRQIHCQSFARFHGCSWVSDKAGSKKMNKEQENEQK